ncbi:MAG TPA: outer membrane beta-barrel protein [Burkholderiales bacterium]
MRFVLFLLAFALAAPAALAQDFRTGFWAGGDVGVGFLKRKFDVTNNRDDTKLAFAIRGGYAFTPRLLLGLEAGGWSLESTNRRDDARGQGISTLYLFGQAYPFEDRLFFVKGGVGGVRFWTNHNGEVSDSGSGFMLGIGNDFNLTNLGSSPRGRFYLTPSVDFSWGHFGPTLSPPGVYQNQSYRAISFRLGVTYR